MAFGAGGGPVTAEDWREMAEEHRAVGMAMVVSPDEYAELVRLRICHDPADMADHTTHVWGVPLVVDRG